jgi:hypothetical protein
VPARRKQSPASVVPTLLSAAVPLGFRL